MNNSEIAEVFQSIAGLLEMKGEPAFTVRAYRQGAATLRDLPESVEAMVREGNDLRLIMPGDITFDTNSTEIKPQFYAVLNDVADVLEQYPATYVDVVGHADSTGDAGYNQRLSEQRAQAVAG